MKKSIFLFFAAILCAVSANAEINFSGGYIYFDNSIGINQTNIQLCARQNSWTGFSTFSTIENTKLLYVKDPQGSGWGGILGWVVIGNSSTMDNQNFDDWSSCGWCSDWNTYGFNSGSTYLIVPSSTEKGKSVSTSYYGGGWKDLNSKQTIKSAYKVQGGNYTETKTPAQISITSYALNGNGTSQQQNYNLATSAQSVSVNAARTATTTLKIDAVQKGYKFDGWFTGLNDGDRLSEELTYTYYPTAATTIYARFSEDAYFLAGTLDGNNNWAADELRMEKDDEGNYSYTFSDPLAAGEYLFKVTDGTWGKDWNWNNVVGQYCELSADDPSSSSSNIKLTLSSPSTFTITFNKTANEISFDGLTGKYTYVLMGVDGDWDNGIEMIANPDPAKTDEYILLNQLILSANDAVKAVTLDCGSPIAYNNTVKSGSVAYELTPDYEQNIVLANGVYNFYFDIWNGIYIEKSAAEDLTLTGMTKTIFNRGLKQHTSLDLGDNSIQILNGADAFGYGTYDVQAYLADDDITVAGFGTWEVVEGVETLTATLVDDEKTKVYNLTATVAAIETYNLSCDDAHYYKPNMMETIFVGEVDGETLTVSVESLVVGENYSVLGIYGETDFLAETVIISVSGLTTYVLTGAFKDATGNIYNVSMTATPLPKTPVVVENATYTEVDGDIIITGDWSGTELTVTLYGYATSDNVLYEEAEMETDDIWAASTEVTLNKTADAFTITGEFIHGWEAAIYNVTISGTLPVPAPDYTRTVVTGEWGTICLPKASSSVTGATFYEVSYLVEGQGLWLDQLADGVQLEAGKPYIFKATDSEIKVTYTGEAKDAPVAGANGLTGTFTNIEAGGLTGNYIIAENKVWVAGSGATLSANRAYIDATKVPKTAQAQLPGRRRVQMGENAATGLDNITNGENTVIKTIENGQLIIIRNGEKFNAQGVRL